MFRKLTAWLVLAASMGVAGCGGGGGSSGTPPFGGGGGGTGDSGVATLRMALDASSISSASAEAVTVTVTALDSANLPVSAAAVAITSDSGDLTVAATSTDSSGVITASISVGADKTPRAVKITATSGKVTTTTTLQIVPEAKVVSELRMSFNTNTISNTGADTVEVTIVAVNSSNVPVADAAVSFSADSGVLTAPNTTTDANGVITATVAVGADKTPRTVNVSATAGSVSTSSSFQIVLEGAMVADLRMAFSSTSISNASSDVVTVTVTAVNATNVVVPGASVVFETDSGVLTALSTVTDSNGTITATVGVGSVKTPRTVHVTARSGTVSTVGSFQIIPERAVVAELRMALNKTSINNSGSDFVIVTVTAVNANRVPVAGAAVNFTASSGVLTALSATTDASGIIQASIAVGANKTPRVVTVTAALNDLSTSSTFSIVTDPALVTQLRLSLSSAQIGNTGSEQVVVNVRALNSVNVVVPGASVALASDTGQVTALTTVTDAAGIVTATVGVGTDKRVRTVNVIATSGSVSASGAFQVVAGTQDGASVADIRVSLSAATLTADGNSTLTVTATTVNSNNQVVSGAPVVVSANSGGVITTSQKITDANGDLRATVGTGANLTPRTITVTAVANGISRSASFEVLAKAQDGSSVADVRLTLSAAVLSNTSGATITATAVAVNSSNQIVAGAPVIFTAGNGGVVTTADSKTDATGKISASVGYGTDPTARTITVSASSNGITKTSSFRVISGGGEGVPVLKLSLSSSTVTSLAPATIRVFLVDAQGSPVPGVVVSLSSVRGLGALSSNTVLTNGGGIAFAKLYPASNTTSGADEILATATIGAENISTKIGFQVRPTTVGISQFFTDIGAGTLSAYGQANVSVDLSGVTAGSPVTLALTSVCSGKGKATITPTQQTVTNASAAFTYVDGGCGATDVSDTLTIAIVGTTTTKSISLKLASPAASSLGFVSAVPEVIFLKGSGYAEESLVTFIAKDQAGNPLPRQVVTLMPTTLAGGLTLNGGADAVTLISDSNGKVTVRLNAGTVPTPVRVKASLVSTGASTVSSQLSIAVGLPSQLNFSLSQKTVNIEGWNYDGEPNSYTIYASDRMGNPVPNGTSINFVAEGGQVESVKQTTLTAGIASATAGFVSQEPRPDDGRVTVVAYAIGEESFIDTNGDNVYTNTGSKAADGEAFQDLGDIFLSRTFVMDYNAVVDQYITSALHSGTTCAEIPGSKDPLGLLKRRVDIPSVAKTCNGIWSKDKEYVRRSTETVLSTSSPRFSWLSYGGGTLDSSCTATTINVATVVPPAVAPQVTLVNVGPGILYGVPKSGSLTFLLSDTNPNRLNPMPAGTELTATSTTAGASVKGGSPVPSTSAATALSVGYDFADNDSPTASDTIFLTATSPRGLKTTYAFAISRAALPGSACSLP